jgi:type VI secretion system protein ImpJ
MTWFNKVIWTEGMFLQPQHFQQHDRFVSLQLHSRLGMLQGYGWGFTSLTLDSSALTLGKIAIAAAQGL